MPDFHSVQILDDGPSGNVVLTLDKTGLKDANSRLVLAPHQLTYNIDVPGLGTPANTYVWTCHEGVWQVASVRSIISASGGASAAAQVVVCAGVTALGSGVAQLTAALDLQETAPDRQNGTLIASPTNMFPGDSLGLVFTGTLTALIGCITILLKRTA